VLARQAPGRRDADQITLFDSVGFALQDYSALRFMRDAAKELGLGQVVSLIPELVNPKDLFVLIHPDSHAAARHADAPTQRAIQAVLADALAVPA